MIAALLGRYALPLAIAAMFIAAGGFLWWQGGQSARQTITIDNLTNERATNDAITDAENRANACGDDWLERLRCHRGE